VRDERVQLWLAGAALIVLWAVATTIGPFSDTTVNDLYVYRLYADLLVGGQLPYLDFGFEYPPLAALPLGLAGLPGTGEATYAVSFAVLMAGCALVGQQLAARLAGSGSERSGAARARAVREGSARARAAREGAARAGSARAGAARAGSARARAAREGAARARAARAARDGVVVAWLLALTPVVIGASVRTHFDALPIALALGGLLALARERPQLGFALLGLGTMTKLFPGLLAVIAFAWLLARGERRAALRGAATFAAIVLAISLPFAGHGYVESFTFHLDRPVQIESTPAMVLFALGGSDVTGTNLRPDRFKSNGLDGGHADAVERLFALLLVAALAGIVALAARGGDARRLVLCAFAALLAFVSLGKVFSPQYVIWLAPFAALAWAWGRRTVALLTGAAIVLTQVEFPGRYSDLINQRHDVIWIVGVRDALLLAALGVLVARLARPSRGVL
jgi:glycosyl transferase family 87